MSQYSNIDLISHHFNPPPLPPFLYFFHFFFLSFSLSVWSIIPNDCVTFSVMWSRAVCQPWGLACIVSVWMWSLWRWSAYIKGGGGVLWPGIAHTVALWEGNSHFRHLFVFCFSKKRWDNWGSVNLINRPSAVQQWHDGLSCYSEISFATAYKESWTSVLELG